MGIQEFSNLKANLSSMNKFFAENDVKLSDTEKAQIKSIFNEANTQKETDKTIEEQLTGEERIGFLDKIKTTLPNIYNKIVDFFVAVEVTEDLEKNSQEYQKNPPTIE